MKNTSPMHRMMKSNVDKPPGISIKCMEIKFMRYLNNLSSSIVAAKKKSVKGPKNSNLSSNGSFLKHNSDDSFESLQLNSSIGSRSSRPGSRRQRSIDFKVVKGQLSHGSSQDQVVIKYRNGSKFVGIMQKFKQKSGKLTTKDWVKYVGNFQNNRLHGKGSLFLHNGTEYRSTFDEGVINNKCEIIYDNGQIYKGQIQRFKKHGHGQLFLNNGDRYQGEFQDGEICGNGKFYKNGQIIAEGLWKNGQFMSFFCSNSDEVLEDDYLR